MFILKLYFVVRSYFLRIPTYKYKLFLFMTWCIASLWPMAKTYFSTNSQVCFLYTKHWPWEIFLPYAFLITESKSRAFSKIIYFSKVIPIKMISENGEVKWLKQKQILGCTVILVNTGSNWSTTLLRVI